MLRSTQRKAVVAGLATLTLASGLGVAANAAPAPAGIAITGLSVVKGATTAKTSTLITGTGFLQLEKPGVKFGATDADKIIVLSDTQIAAVSPVGSAGKVDVQLVDDTTVYDALTLTNAAKDDFTYVVPYDATVATGSLMNSLGGSKLSVTSSEDMGTCAGTTAGSFASNKVTATVNGVIAPVTCVTPTKVALTVPAGTPTSTTTGPKVVLFHDGVPGAASNAAKYAAVIGGIDKPVGPVTPGATDSVTITGKGFKDATTWKFGDAAATCTPATLAAEVDVKISCLVPAQTATGFAGGAVSISFDPAGTVPFGSTSKATYTYSDLG